MRWPTFQFRFGLRTLMLAVLVTAVAIGLWTAPGRWREYRNIQARKRIDPYELSIAKSDCPDGLPRELVAILGDSRLKHWERLTKLELLPGDLLAAYGYDGLRVWDLKTTRERYHLPARSMAVSRDGKRLFVSVREGWVQMIDPARGSTLAELELARADQNFAMATNRDGSRLLTNVWLDLNSSQLRVWDVAAKSLLWTTDVTGRSSDAIALNGAGTRVAWTANRKLFVKDIESDAEPLVVDGMASEFGPTGFSNVTFSHDDAVVIAITGLHHVMAYDAASGEATPWIAFDDLGSIDGFTLSDSGDDLVVRLSNRLYSFSPSGTGEWHERVQLACVQGHVGAVAMQKRVLAAGHFDHSISLWDRYRPGRPWRLPGGSLRPDVTSLSFHPDRKRLITGSRDGQMVVWSTRDWREIHRWKAHVAEIGFLACSPDGRWLASSSEDSRVVVWDATNYNEQASIGNFQLATPVSFTSDGSRLATNSDGPPNPGLYDLPAGSVATMFPAGKTPWRSGMMSISPAGDQLVVAKGKAGVQLFDVATLKSRGTFAGEDAEAFWGRITWSPDGSLVAMHGFGGSSARLWDATTCKLVKTFDAGAGNLESVTFDATGQWLAMCGSGMPVQIWHVPTGKRTKAWQIGPAGGTVSQVHFSPDGHYLAVVNGNGTAYVLSLDGVLKE